MSSQIEVWLDDTSDADEAAWCVSLCGGDGQEVRLLSAHQNRGEAVEAGREAAQEKGLRLCERSEFGHVSELASAETMRMQAMLLRRGDRFSGNDVEAEAEKWAEHGFDADAADDWCEIGVWDAAAAAEFRDAGLTPEKARAAADKLTEGLEDPVAEYACGDPIYAVCNGDVDVSVIIGAVSDLE